MAIHAGVAIAKFDVARTRNTRNIRGPQQLVVHIYRCNFTDEQNLQPVQNRIVNVNIERIAFFERSPALAGICAAWLTLHQPDEIILKTK